jgi:heme exporter protein C
MADAPLTTASRGTRLVGAAAALSGIALFVYAFGVSKPDTQLGESVRIMYVHVPTVTASYLCLFVAAAASVYYLVTRSEFADLLAATCAEIGTVLLALTLATGMLWGRTSWGTYWEWDPRLTTTALLFFMMIGYLVVRSVPAPPRTRGTRSAVVAVISAALIPIVHRSVEWWSSLHQESTVLGRADAQIGGTQLFSLFLGFVTFALLVVWLGMHRFRVAWLAERAAEAELEVAIAERRATRSAEALG